MSVHDLSFLEDLRHELAEHPIVVVLFGAPWCGPCTQFKPHFKIFSDKIDNGKCFYVNVDNDHRIVKEFEIQSVPQVMLFRDGRYAQHLTARQVIPLMAEYYEAI